MVTAPATSVITWTPGIRWLAASRVQISVVADGMPRTAVPKVPALYAHLAVAADAAPFVVNVFILVLSAALK